MTTAEIYQVREWIYDPAIELQGCYGVIIMASAVPPTPQAKCGRSR